MVTAILVLVSLVVTTTPAAVWASAAAAAGPSASASGAQSSPSSLSSSSSAAATSAALTSSASSSAGSNGNGLASGAAFDGAATASNQLGLGDAGAGAGPQLSSRVVHTKYGAVSGVIVQLDGRNLDPVEAFKGVPYASPPVGSLRFMPPVTGALWSGVKKADRYGPVCPQRLPDIANETVALEKMPRGRLEFLRRMFPYLQNQSEDCLYLNIYAPVQVGSRDSGSGPTKYPVMVFVHGESYEWNSGNPYDGSILASYGQILVVTINYRLGILGFLNANTDRNSRAPANYGLMDIIAALHWLQENIGAFGGDSSSVTLVGHGTGAACVHFLISSNAVPEGMLFHRAVLMSGSGLAPWSLVGDPAYYAAAVASHVNCSPELPYSHLMKCLRERPLEALLSTPVRPPEFGNAFGPSVDGVVIDTDEIAPPVDQGHYDYGVPTPKVAVPQTLNTLNTINAVLMRKTALNKLSRYDLLAGVTRAEAYFAFNSGDVQYGIEADRRARILRTYVRNTYSYHLNEILATIVNEYTDWERPVQHPINIRDETLEALSDAQFVAPAAQTVDLHSADHRNSFLYVFDYQTKFGDYAQRQGCIHGEDLAYLFGAPLVGGFNHFTRNFTKSEVALAEAVMLYWSNFVRSGNPNEPQEPEHGGRQERSRFKNIEWTAYESVHKKFLNIDNKPKLKNHYRAHRLSFWLNLVPDLHRPGSDEVPLSHHQLGADDADSEDGNGRDRRYHDTTVRPLNPPPNQSQQQPHNYSTLIATQMFALFNVTAAAKNASKKPDGDGGSASTGAGGNNEELHSNEPAAADGFAAYSTALSVTIAIGCSLLILNVLIFAGVYYQRDKTRQHEPRVKKRNENGVGLGGGGVGGVVQMPNNICGELEVLGMHHTGKGDPATILGHHHVAMQQQQHQQQHHQHQHQHQHQPHHQQQQQQHHQHQMPPPEFADIPHRAPPPPKHLKSMMAGEGGQQLQQQQQQHSHQHPALQPQQQQQQQQMHSLQMLSGGGVSNCGTLQKKSCVKNSNHTAMSSCPGQMDELRV